MEIYDFSEIDADAFDIFHSVEKTEVWNGREVQIQRGNSSDCKIYRTMGRVTIETGADRERGPYVEGRWEIDFDKRAEGEKSAPQENNSSDDPGVN